MTFKLHIVKATFKKIIHATHFYYNLFSFKTQKPSSNVILTNIEIITFVRKISISREKVI